MLISMTCLQDEGIKILLYNVIQCAILFFSEAKTEKTVEKPGQKPQSCLLLPADPVRGGHKPKASKKTNIHVMVEFGLQVYFDIHVLQSRLFN